MTDKQKQVHELKAAGLKQAEIARKLGISRTRVYYILNPEKKRIHKRKYEKALRARERAT